MGVMEKYKCQPWGMLRGPAEGWGIVPVLEDLLLPSHASNCFKHWKNCWNWKKKIPMHIFLPCSVLCNLKETALRPLPAPLTLQFGEVSSKSEEWNMPELSWIAV